MKTKALMVIVFLLLCSAILASGNDSEAEEYWRKTQELNRRAEQFKAETGFEGDIGYSYQAMGFTNYRGNFRDIPVTVPQDTVAMGKVFEQVLTKVKPYIRAREGQLFREAIVSRVNRTFVTYRQRVNGYGIDGAGILRIDYNIETNKIVVTDNTVDIPDIYVMPVLTNEDVINIYTTTVPDDEILNMFSNRSPRFRLSYCNIYKYQFEKSPEYRLCWVGGSTRELVIDSISGEIYVNELSVIHDLTVNVAGTALLDSDSNGNLQVSSADFFDTRVYADSVTPFINPSTTINFSVPKTASVSLVIYNIRGQKVKELLNESLEYGNHSVVWNGRDESNRSVASGVYFARLEQSGVTKVSKMMLVK